MLVFHKIDVVFYPTMVRSLTHGRLCSAATASGPPRLVGQQLLRQRGQCSRRKSAPSEEVADVDDDRGGFGRGERYGRVGNERRR